MTMESSAMRDPIPSVYSRRSIRRLAWLVLHQSESRVLVDGVESRRRLLDGLGKILLVLREAAVEDDVNGTNAIEIAQDSLGRRVSINHRRARISARWPIRGEGKHARVPEYDQVARPRVRPDISGKL